NNSHNSSGTSRSTTSTMTDSLPTTPIEMGSKDNKGETRVSTVDLLDGTVYNESAAPKGFAVQQLACDDGHPVLAGPAKAGGGSSTGSGKLSVDRTGNTTVVTADGGRVDQLAVDGDTITAAVFHKGTESLITLDAKSGKETHRATLSGLMDAEGIQRTKQGWLVFSEDAAALVAPSSSTAKKIKLPGKLLAS
ncbi:hypothetical protein ACGFND_39765, partial [Streptomyces sp. NPDC048638]